MKNFENLCEVKKSVRFELMPYKKEIQARVELDVLNDINFYISFLKNKSIFDGLNNNNCTSFFSNISEIFTGVFLDSFYILENELYKMIYNPIRKYNSDKEAKKIFKKEVEKLNLKEDYIPGEDFVYPKKSEVFYSIKFLAKIIIENNLLKYFDKKYHKVLNEINIINPNSENIFNLKTLNPYTVNRWKKESIINNYKVAFFERNKKIIEANEVINELLEKILESTIFSEKNLKSKTLSKYHEKFWDIQEDDISYERLIRFINKYDTFLRDKKIKQDFKYKQSIDEKELFGKINYNFTKKQKNRSITGEINTLNGELFGYKVQLIDNFGIDTYSFLIEQEKQEKKYYFLVEKDFASLSEFLDFIDNFESGTGKIHYIDSMTFGGFEKLFLNEKSDVDFRDKNKVSGYNKELIEFNKKIIELKTGKIDEYNTIKKECSQNIKDKKDTYINDFLEYLSEGGIQKNINDVFEYDKKKKIEKFTAGKELKKYLDKKYPYSQLSLTLEKLDNEYKNKVIDFILEIYNKEYKVGNKYRSLDFLDKEVLYSLKSDEKTLEDLKMYFNKVGYTVVTKNISFEKIIQEAEEGRLGLSQIKSKDYNFYNKEFIPKNHRAKHTSSKEQQKEGRKDLQTLYFEDFFNGNNTKIGADFKIRGINSSHNLGELLESFWKKEKNIIRHTHQKEKIHTMRTRFTRNRKYIDFFLTKNANKYISGNNYEEKLTYFNKQFIPYFKGKKSLKAMVFDHGETNFLTYNIFDIKNISKVPSSKNYNNFQLQKPHSNLQEKYQRNIQKSTTNHNEILDQYINKYHIIIQAQKRERQVQEGLKEFANKSIRRIKEIVSNNINNSLKQEQQVYYFIENIIDCWNLKNNNNLYAILKKNYYFDYTLYKYKNLFPDNKNIVSDIDNYLEKLYELLKNKQKLRNFCEIIKKGLDGISEADEIKYGDTEFYYYKKYFKSSLAQINNLKKGYHGALIGDICKKIISGRVDILVFENNILSYGVENSKTAMKYAGTDNHGTFIQALINKLSYLRNKEDNSSYQLVYQTQQKDAKKLENSSNGILFFVEQENTSLICPDCDKIGKRIKSTKDFENQKSKITFPGLLEKIVKYIEKNEKVDIVYCNSCGFSTIDHEKFKNGDDLATYNIAKKAKEYLELCE